MALSVSKPLMSRNFGADHLTAKRFRICADRMYMWLTYLETKKSRLHSAEEEQTDEMHKMTIKESHRFISASEPGVSKMQTLDSEKNLLS